MLFRSAELLEKDWNVAANVWSVTSFSELRRDGMRAERARRLGGADESWVARCLKDRAGPVIAASDYVSAVADLIRAYVPGRYVALGTDGFGRSDTRSALRRFFEVDRHHVVLAALQALVRDGRCERSVLADAVQRYGVAAEAAAPWTR